MYGENVQIIFEVLKQNGGELKLKSIIELSGFEGGSVRKAVSRLVKQGLLERPKKGYYKITGKTVQQKYNVMWRFLKVKKTVSYGDLMEIADTSKTHAFRFLNILEKRGIIRENNNGTYTIIKQNCEQPKNWETKKNSKILEELKNIKENISKLITQIEKEG